MGQPPKQTGLLGVAFYAIFILRGTLTPTEPSSPSDKDLLESEEQLVPDIFMPPVKLSG
jgi:hypothetical protein